ncbi:helix-turn-helix transcriptional regulator [Candidatus Omnitrophota bacterium]
MITLYRSRIVMKKALGIKKAAQERGVTLASIAAKLHMHRANMSAIASGARGVSLNILKKISRILDCSLDELVFPNERPHIFKDKRLQAKLKAIEQKNKDGVDKTWVHNIMIAHRQHFKTARRTH